MMSVNAHRAPSKPAALSVSAAAVLLFGIGLGDASAAVVTDSFVPCNSDCTWSIEVDGVSVGSGFFAVDPGTGVITLGAPVDIALSDGTTVGLSSLSGNADPILGFNFSAGTGAAGKTFAFNFNLPIALSGAIDANSSVSYSLTALTAAGAQITPLFGKTIIAQEVDTSVGGLAPLNKGVDVGNLFFFVAGPQTQNSPVYTASNTFTGDLAYDLMSVTAAFSLSANSQVGASGFVQQVQAVPLPAAAWLLLSGVGFVGGVARRRRSVLAS